MDLKKYFDYVLNNYLLPENMEFSSSKEYYKVIVNKIPSEISKVFNNSIYKIYGSCGKGAKSAAPYVAIINRKISTTTQKGIYVDFIFKSDMSGFYLTIDQGITSIKDKYGNKESKIIAQKAANYFRNLIDDNRGFENGLVSGHAKAGSLEEGYENTRVLAKFYEKGNYTNEEVTTDLNSIMKIYDTIFDKMDGKNYEEIVESMNEKSSYDKTNIDLSTEHYTWVPVFYKIAKRLMNFRNDRTSLLNIMYDFLTSIGALNEESNTSCHLDKYNGVRCKYDDFDPFSFMNRFALLNFENKQKLIRYFEEKTNMDVDIPSDFDGVPSVNPRMSCMLVFKDVREPNDVDDFWNLFEIALKYPEDKSLEEEFIKYYDICVAKPNCKFNITSCLFRMNANFYPSLDSTNRCLLKEKFGIDIKKCPTGKKYIELIKDIKEKISVSEEFDSLYDFSHKAWLSIKEKGKNSKVWLFAPGTNAKFWEDCLENSAMMIGWDELGDLNNYRSIDEIIKTIKEKNNEPNPKQQRVMLRDFLKNVKIGDVVIARKGLKSILGYGIVTSDSYYNESRERYRNCRDVEWQKVGEWENTTNYKFPQVAITSLSDENANKLLSIINGDGNMNSNISEWIIPANPKLYDHFGSFEKNGFIDWSQNVNFNVGDIVYMYSSQPESRITAKLAVEKIDLTFEEKIDDSDFYLSNNLEDKRKEKNRFARLRLVEKIDDDRLKYDELAKHGLWGRPMNAGHIPDELSNYIRNVLSGSVIKNKENICGINVIYYGGPGCGKSFFVDHMYCNTPDTYIRTTFYPDYTNSDFVGQLIPKYDKVNEKLIYDIQPGPFTKALELALKPENINRNIYLIIEEINRGNAAAIFGDIFQLLDRDESGNSQFKISNYVIEKYIGDQLGIDITNEVKIPANLSIIATMNTSDQNVYILDSAFKRRWDMKYISNKFGINDTSREYDELLGSKNVPIKELNITWKDFVGKINKAIVEENAFGINSEDKQLGKYFVGSSDLISSEVYETNDFNDAATKFAEKVLMYLWEDIAKLDPSAWFRNDIKTFEKLLDDYQTEGINIFSENIKNRLKSDVDERREEVE